MQFLELSFQKWWNCTWTQIQTTSHHTFPELFILRWSRLGCVKRVHPWDQPVLEMETWWWAVAAAESMGAEFKPRPLTLEMIRGALEWCTHSGLRGFHPRNRDPRSISKNVLWLRSWPTIDKVKKLSIGPVDAVSPWTPRRTTLQKCKFWHTWTWLRFQFYTTVTKYAQKQCKQLEMIFSY